MASIDATVVGIALPAIGRDFGATLTALQWVITCYTLTLAGLLLFAGTQGDRYGRKRIFLTGVVTARPSQPARTRWSWLRELTPSLVKTLPRWYWTVRVLMNRREPISGLDRPSRASRATCASWAVSGSLAWPCTPSLPRVVAW